uniref:Uncharacterized protein n=1 Tax=Parascaris equorum TaxID=6256 RepID=A0A914RTN6_PAREQ
MLNGKDYGELGITVVDWRDHLAVYEERFMELLDEVISIDEEPMAIFIPPRESLKVGFICSSELYTANDRFSHPKLLENLQREFYAGRSKSGYIIVGNSKLEVLLLILLQAFYHIEYLK